MCTWMAALAIGGALASTVANTVGSNEQEAARARALAAERERQGRLNRESRGLVQDTAEQYGKTKENQAAKSEELADIFRAPADDINTDAGLLPTARGAVSVSNVKDARGKAATEAGQQGDARANLRAFGDVMGDNALNAAQNSSQLGMVNNFKAGSASILPMELEAANSAGGIWRMLGDLGNLTSAVATPAWLGGQDIGDLGSIFAPTVATGAPGAARRPTQTNTNTAYFR